MPGQGRLGDKANVAGDAHGCPGCPHPGSGPAISGSATVFVNGRPALRVDDVGIHAACCGANMWQAQSGSATVFINGKAAFRINDPARHCGGQGKLVEGSGDVIVGDATSSGAASNGASAKSSDGDAKPTGDVIAPLAASPTTVADAADDDSASPTTAADTADDDSSPDDEPQEDMTIELVDGIGHGLVNQGFHIAPAPGSNPQDQPLGDGKFDYHDIPGGAYSVQFKDVAATPVPSVPLPADDQARPVLSQHFSPLHRLTRREFDKQFLAATGGHRRFLLEPRVGTLFELEHFRDRGGVFVPGRDPNPLRPGAPGDDRHRVTGTAALAAAIAHGTAKRGVEKLGITGHAAAPDEKTLSQQRARNAMLILTGDATPQKGWPDNAAQAATVDDTKEVLAWIAARFDVDCDPTHPNALDGFVPGYNAFTFTTSKRSAPVLTSADASGGVGNANVWAAFLDFYFEDIAAILGTTNEDARAQAAALEFFADDAPPPPPPPPKKDPKPYLLIRRIDQIFPVKIAEISTGDANQWVQLNPLNPGSLLDPSHPSAGWRNMKPGERIYLPLPPQVPFEWGPKLEAAGYDIRDENDPDSDPQFDSDGRPLGYSHLVIRSTDSVWPVKLAQEALSDAEAARYTELDPLNPHLMRGNNQWKDLYAGDKINLPTQAMDPSADPRWAGPDSKLREKYQIVDEPAPQKKQAPPPAQSPTERATGCQSHHVDAPFANDANRRGAQRRAEAVFVAKRDEPLRICKQDPPCVTDSCDLYDPLEFELAYAKTDPLQLPLPRIVCTFLHRVIRDGEANPVPRVCQPFRLRTDLAGPAATADDLKLIQWTCTVGDRSFAVPSQRDPENHAPQITHDGDKIRIDFIPDDWFGQPVSFTARFPGQEPIPPATSVFLFERSEVDEYIALVRKVEMETGFDAPTVAGALRRLAGYDDDLSQFLLGTSNPDNGTSTPAKDLQPTGALTQADIDRLRQLSGEEDRDGIETGGAKDDPLGVAVAMGHVVRGLCAGLNRLEKLTFTVVAAATPMAFLRGRAASLPLQVDNLYATTLANDLGQVASNVFDLPDAQKPKPGVSRVGASTAANDAELAGDVDGFLIGLSKPSGVKVSDVLARYYCVRGNDPDVTKAARRFHQIASATPSLDDQAQTFCAIFWMRKHGRAMGAFRHIPTYPLERLGFEVKPTLDAYRKWLDAAQKAEDDRKKLADDADARDTTDGFTV